MSLSRRQRLRLVRGGVYAATIAALVLIALAVDWGALGGALFKWNIVKDQFPDILTNALRNTVIFTIFGFIGGLSLGLLLAIMRLSSVKPYRWFAATYIEVLRGMNSDNARKVPADAPTEFIKPRWQKLVMTDTGIDRRYYELCALSELKNALRSGDIWVQGSRQFKDFEDYLVPPAKFASLKQASELPLAVATDCDQYLHDRLTLLETQLATVNRMATANELPDAIITESGLKITPLDAAVPDTAQALIDQTAMILPHVKITELLLEVDEWTGFTRHFAHLKSGDPAKDKNLLLTTILADAINLGLTKMAESCPGTTYAKLAWLQAWHIRDETYGAALADLVNAFVDVHKPWDLAKQQGMEARLQGVCTVCVKAFRILTCYLKPVLPALAAQVSALKHYQQQRFARSHAALLADPRFGAAIQNFVAPIPRRAKPEEIASMIVYLLGPEAGFIHGSQFTVDGGIDALARPTQF